MPISAFGLRLDNDSIRITVGLRLGLPLCSCHTCPCGEQVDSRGVHGLSCRASAGRSARHFLLNDIICRALASASIPSVKEPVGLGSYIDEDGVEKGLRPDGLKLIPWSSGRCLAWDATVSDTLAPSYLALSIHSAGAVAEAAADRKRRKYSCISGTHHFISVAVESLGPICSEGASFLSEIAEKISRTTGEKREKSYLFQRISVAIQRGNAAAFHGTLTSFSVNTLAIWEADLDLLPLFLNDFNFLYFDFYLIFAYRKLSTVGW